jgi:sugar/nucleoside kinase (ribokinase family)
MLDVLLPCASFCDLVFTGLPDIPRLGDEVYSHDFKIQPGAGFIPAAALTRLGMNVGWASDFGNDFFSRYVLEEAGRQNLDPALFRKHDRPLQAVSVSFSFAHDRAFLSYMDPLPVLDLAALVRANPARCLLLMSLHHDPGIPRIVETAHAQGSIVFMDGQGNDSLHLDDPHVQAALRSVDIFAPNRKEALYLTREKTPEAALARLAELVPTVLIKLGADGVIASHGGSVVHMPGIAVDVVDTTGAGDNFDCGFVYGLLHGYSLEDCLRSGNYCGGRSTTAHGGWYASPTEDQLKEYLKD